MKRKSIRGNFKTGRTGWIMAKTGGNDLLCLVVFHGRSEDSDLCEFGLSFFEAVFGETPIFQNGSGSWALVSDRGLALAKAAALKFGGFFQFEICVKHLQVCSSTIDAI